VQIEQDIRLCEENLPALTCRAIAAQFMAGSEIALFEFEDSDKGIRKVAERHYRLVSPEALTGEELRKYKDPPSTS
jgi:hypothetical protein